MSNPFKKIQTQGFTLAGAGSSIADQSIVLSSMLTIDGTPITMSMLGTKCFFTIEPGNGVQEEAGTFSGIIQNVNGTATLTGVKHQMFEDPYTETAGLNKSHAGGTSLILSNTAGFYGNFVDVVAPEAVSTFTPTTDYQLTTKTWVETRNGYWEGSVANFADLPLTGNSDGAARVTLDDSKLYVWSDSTNSWNLAGAGGGAGTVYIDTFLGTESTGDDNQTFTLTSGSFPNKKYLQVYKNGVLQVEGAGNDYVATSSNQAIFEDVVLDDDIITMLVVSVDLYNPAWNSVNADILPDTDNAYDIGSTTKKFKDLNLSGNANISGTTTLNVAFVSTSTPTQAGQIVGLDEDGKLPALNAENLLLYLNTVASDNLKISLDEVVSNADEGTGFLRQIRVGKNGVVRVKVEGAKYPGHPSGMYIQKNGATIATPTLGEHPTYGAVCSVDVPVAAGDLIQINYTNGNSTATTWVKNFRIYYDNALISDIVIQ